MCRQAGSGASAGAPLPPTSVVLRTPPAAHEGPRRVRKQPGSVSGSPCGSGLGDGSSEHRGRGGVALHCPCSLASVFPFVKWVLDLSRGRQCLLAAEGGKRRQVRMVLKCIHVTTALRQLARLVAFAGFSEVVVIVATVLCFLPPCLAQ